MPDIIIPVGISLDSSGAVTGVNLANQAFDRLGGKTGELQNKLSGVESVFKRLGLVFAGYVGFKGIEGTLNELFQRTVEYEESNRRLNAVLQSTGHALGYTRGEVEGMTQALAKSTIFDDEQIRNAAAILATFRGVQGQVFADALKGSTQLASLFGRDLATAALMMGRALTDPIDGLGALTRAGVSFRDSDRAMIAEMIRTGDVAAALTLILGRVTYATRGQGATDPNSVSGAATITKKAWHEFLEELGRTPTYQGAMQGFFNWVTETLGNLSKNVTGKGGIINQWTEYWRGLGGRGVGTWIADLRSESRQIARALASNDVERMRTTAFALTTDPRVFVQGRERVAERLRQMKQERDERAAVLEQQVRDQAAYENAMEGVRQRTKDREKKEATDAAERAAREFRQALQDQALKQQREERERAIRSFEIAMQTTGLSEQRARLAALLAEHPEIGEEERKRLEGLAAQAEITQRLKEQTAAYSEMLSEARGLLMTERERRIESARRRDLSTEQIGDLDYYYRLAEEAEKAKAEAKRFEEFWKQGLRNTEDAFADFFYKIMSDGTLTFGDFMRNLIAMWQKMLAQLAAQSSFRAILGALRGGGGGEGAIMNWDLPGHIMHGGGLVGGAGPTRLVPVSAFAGARRLHGGGAIGTDEVPVIAQRGEIVLSRRQAASSGAVIVHQTLNFHAQAVDNRGMADLLKAHGPVIAGEVLKATRQSLGYRRALVSP